MATTKRVGAAQLQRDLLELSARVDKTGDGRLRQCVRASSFIPPPRAHQTASTPLPSQPKAKLGTGLCFHAIPLSQQATHGVVEPQAEGQVPQTPVKGPLLQLGNQPLAGKAQIPAEEWPERMLTTHRCWQ